MQHITLHGVDMPLGKTIRLYLIDGTATGPITAKDFWTRSVAITSKEVVRLEVGLAGVSLGMSG